MGSRERSMQVSFLDERQDAYAIEDDDLSTTQQFRAFLLQDEPCRLWRCGKMKRRQRIWRISYRLPRTLEGGAMRCRGGTLSERAICDPSAALPHLPPSTTPRRPLFRLRVHPGYSNRFRPDLEFGSSCLLCATGIS